MFKFFFNLFVYISLIFLGIALYKNNYLHFPKICSISFFLSSFLFLFAGFIGHAYTWKRLLDQFNYKVSFKHSLASTGLTVFGKYIPGKIWMIVGRSSYISRTKNFDAKKIIALSLYLQIFTIGIAFTLGLLGLIVLRGFNLAFSLLIVCFFLLLLFCFFSYFLLKASHKIYNFNCNTEALKNIAFLPNTFSLLLWCGAYWSLWAIGFYLLIIGITNTEVTVLSGLGFPLSSTIGIVAFFVPGGLGVREGVMSGYLTLSGFSIQSAATIAVAARLWFLIGELFIFILGLIFHNRRDAGNQIIRHNNSSSCRKFSK